MPTYFHLIDGQLVEGSGSVEIVNPHTESTVAVVPRATTDEADYALAAARRTFDGGAWADLPAKERSRVLRGFADALQDRREELVELAIRQTGAVRVMAEGLQTDATLQAAHWYAEHAAHIDAVEHFETAPTGQAPGFRLVERVPAGVAVAITPFNYPFSLNVHKLMPALATGCSVVLKPNPDSCLDAALIAEVAGESGLPAGALQILLGGGVDVGERLVADERVDVVSFTGSTATGRRIMELASSTVKNVHLELGGKSASIVCADADLDAFFATRPGLLRSSGQGCGQLTRVLAEREVYDEVVDRLADSMKALVVGDPEERSTEVGPLANRAQYNKVISFVQSGIDEGARLVCGGGRGVKTDVGFYVEPTLFADVDAKMRIAREEIFGPVVSVASFSGEAQAIEIANDSIYGINGSVWTRNQAKGWRIARGVRTGSFGINRLADYSQGPHGGFKQTGIGREFGPYSLQAYQELRNFSF